MLFFRPLSASRVKVQSALFSNFNPPSGEYASYTLELLCDELWRDRRVTLRPERLFCQLVAGGGAGVREGAT